ncbi:MAG: hypothetical protein Q9227_001115 [Pyrenula ochraceoflavens]
MSQLPREARVTTNFAPKHYGISARSRYEPKRDKGETRTWDALEGVWFVHNMTWYIQKGDDLIRSRKIEFPFYIAFDHKPTDSDLNIENNLMESSSDRAPVHPKSGISQDCIKRKSREEDGKTIERWEVHYKIMATIESGPMVFSLVAGGKEPSEFLFPILFHDRTQRNIPARAEHDPSPPREPPTLLTVPSELLSQILSHLLTSPTRLHHPHLTHPLPSPQSTTYSLSIPLSTLHPSILLVCRRLAHLGTHLLYTQNLFHVLNPSHTFTSTFLRDTIGPANAARIRHLAWPADESYERDKQVEEWDVECALARSRKGFDELYRAIVDSGMRDLQYLRVYYADFRNAERPVAFWTEAERKEFFGGDQGLRERMKVKAFERKVAWVVLGLVERLEDCGMKGEMGYVYSGVSEAGNAVVVSRKRLGAEVVGENGEGFGGGKTEMWQLIPLDVDLQGRKVRLKGLGLEKVIDLNVQPEKFNVERS